MNSGIQATVSPITPERTVSLVDTFKNAAAGPVQRQDVSFDGKISPADPAQNVSQVVDPEQIAAAVDQIQAYVDGLSRSLNISVDETSGDFIVQVQDATTEEIIRQIPSKEVLAISAAISQQIAELKVMGEEGARGLFLEAIT